MAHKKAGGSSRNGRDSQSKRHPGENVGLGRDHTIFATAAGTVQFSVRGAKNRTYISVVAAPAEAQ